MTKTITIGRDRNNDIVFKSSQASAFHALITLIDKANYKFKIKDLGSYNGTFINDVKVKETEFEIGDKVTIANISLKSSQFLPFFYPENEDTVHDNLTADAPLILGAKQENLGHLINSRLDPDSWPKDSIDATRFGTPSQEPNDQSAITAANSVSTQTSLPQKPRRKSMSWILSRTSRIVLHFAFFVLGGLAALVFTSGISTTALLGFLGYSLLFGTISLISISIYSRVQRLSYQTRQQKVMLNLWELKVATLLVRQSESERNKHSWNGFRKFEIKQKTEECPGVYFFYLVSHDRKPLPTFLPGQHLTFRLKIDGHDKPLIRCYSLSESPAKLDYYRVTIKQLLVSPNHLDVPPGVSSSYFCKNLKAGDFLDVKAPSGRFFLDPFENKPIVLLGGGIGITPLLSMLESVVDWNSSRETWFFYGVRNSGELVMESRLQEIAIKHNNIHLHICFSNPGTDPELGKNYHAERISVNLLKRLLPSNNYLYYFCGPASMMRSLTVDLSDWGVPESSIHFEAFGPASIKTTVPVRSISTNERNQLSQNFEVHFVKSDKVCRWTPEVGSLLDLAEKYSVAIDFGCRAGNCSTCSIAIREGKVKYLSEPGEIPEEGSCFTCISKPSSRLSLDA